ncbi:MAG TPA: hypothetical protein VFO19_03705 [Vicinamibacterales bacterium]|nr:hypothetical protein [Vicinamibacterales bacterium]
MSERTAPSIAKLDTLLPLLKAMPASTEQASLVEETEALRRAVSAFHMEAIRFRMHNVERLLKAVSAPAPATQAFDDLRHTLEAAGFHTRSHAAP